MLALALGACSAPPSDAAPDFGSSGPNGSGAPAPAGAGPSNSSAGSGSGSTSNPPPGAGLGFVEEATPDELFGNTCGGSIFEPERLPLDMYFLVDSSGSMAEPSGAGANKWELVTSALINFLGNPDNGQIGVGIGYFPQGVTPTCTAGQAGCLCIPVINLCLANLGGSCTASDYATPSVPLTLPSVPTRLIDDLQVRAFAGGTPTHAALEGTYQYLETWTAQNPGRKVVAVLATDGEPTGCSGNSAAEVAQLAAAALAGPSHIQTFVIGVGRALANLNQVARAGGTTQAYLTDTSSNLVNEFSEALDAIRTQAGPCAFEIPDSTDEGSVDPAKVNVRFTPRGASEPTIVAKTFGGTADGCGTDGGWHYDDPANPTRIQLCESSCRAAASARMEVQFGCDTVIAPR
ncbi:MAG TPA: vWA domain-containing protein [Polyangiaceae bacterium]|nr:vWA domain-containing protein [Polyangiaceae bacterium]